MNLSNIKIVLNLECSRQFHGVEGTGFCKRSFFRHQNEHEPEKIAQVSLTKFTT